MNVVPADLRGPFDKLVNLLSGIDVVISAIYFDSLDDEIPLADAAKAAGIKRFVQSALMIVMPPRGIVDFREKVPPYLSPTKITYQLANLSTERGESALHPEDPPSIHLHRRRLVVPTHPPPPTIRLYRSPPLPRAQGPTHRSGW